MSKFVLRRTADRNYHLYFDAPCNKDFVKLGKATNAQFLRENISTHVVLSNKDLPTKTLYGIVEDQVFQVELPTSSEIRLIDDVCVYERNSLWYAMMLKDEEFEEVLLGERHFHSLAFPSNFKYNRAYWHYFILKVKNEFELRYFIDGKLTIIGKYMAIRSNENEHIFGIRHNGLIDVFTPYAKSPLKSTENQGFESYFGGIGLFLPYKNVDKWVFHEGFRLLGTNAAYKISKLDEQQIIELYRIRGHELDLVKVSRNFVFKTDPSCLQIDDMCYMFDLDEKLIDLDNPVPTFKKRVLNFFKLK